MRPEPHYIYRAFRADGRLLYVGCSMNVANRLRGHSTSSPWYRLMDSLTVEGPWTFDEARKREADAVSAERPLYNYDTPWRGFASRLRADIAQDVARRLHLSRRYYFEDAWTVADLVAKSLLPSVPGALEPFEYADGLHIDAARAYRRYELDPESFIEVAIRSLLDAGWESVLDHNARPKSWGPEPITGAEAAGRIG